MNQDADYIWEELNVTNVCDLKRGNETTQRYDLLPASSSKTRLPKQDHLEYFLVSGFAALDFAALAATAPRALLLQCEPASQRDNEYFLLMLFFFLFFLF